MQTRSEPQSTTCESPREVGITPPSSDPTVAPKTENEQELVLEDLLVEDVSIDGMCGVY